jgi:hypothetical protein
MNDWDKLKAAHTLLDVVGHQQQQIDSLLGDLKQVAARYEASLGRLPVQIQAGVDAALPMAAENAAKRIASAWTEANSHADRATLAYLRAEKIAPRLLFGAICIGMLVFAIGIVYIEKWVLPDLDTLIAWRSEVAMAQQTVVMLEDRGSRAQVAKCHDQSGGEHLCVRVDVNRRTDLSGFRIIVPKSP